MFNLLTPIKRNFYSQTGNFQFSTNIILSNLFGGLNFGISGSGLNNINFYCNSGKILDNNNKFVEIYNPDELFTISGNVKSSSYDYFINGHPIVYNAFKSTGIYDYFYFSPINLTGAYDFFLNGESPLISIGNVSMGTGDILGTGQIINLKPELPVRIFSGGFTNLDNLPFSLSGFFTGDLKTPKNYFIKPSGADSLGLYTGNVILYTNAGQLNYQSVINITGSPILFSYSLSLDGLSTIGPNTPQVYTSNVQLLSGSGLGVLVTLEYVSGSGSYYLDIPISSGFSGNISKYILNSGFISQFITGYGTGIGGQLNLTSTGLASGFITGSTQYATGTFVWPITNLLVTGYGTGINYSGLGTGLYSTQITGSIIDGSGTFTFNQNIIGNSPSLKTLYSTGWTPKTGKINFNTPSNLDKLYINNTVNTPAIVYGFHYNSLNTLTSYINGNSGTYLVTANNDGVNTIFITGLPNDLSINMKIDNDNIGNMSLNAGVNQSLLSGGFQIGIGSNIISTTITGFLNSIFTGSGVYQSTGEGIINGSGVVLDYIKTFTGSWNLFTGSPFEQIDYLYQGYYNNNKTKYENNLPASFFDSTQFINILYNNPNLNHPEEVALLTITGFNVPTGLQLLITGQLIN